MKLRRGAWTLVLVLSLLAAPIAAATAKGNRVSLGAEMSKFGPEAGALEDPEARELFTKRFDSLTAGNEFKWAVVEPSQGDFDFSHAEPFVAFAEGNDKEFRGHTLVWHGSIPQWLADRDPATPTGSLNPWTKPELLQVMKNHITTVVKRFKSEIDAWDVVNEPFNNDGSLRDSLFYRVIGPGYIKSAFRFAHRADPKAKLYLNEFGIEVENTKSDAVVDFVRELREDGVPIDGLGSQTHIHAASGLSAGDLKPVMREVANAGLEFEVTELDVPIANPGAPGALEAQASQYRAVGKACKSIRACNKITTWGLTDAYTWQPPQSIPLLFAADNSPKPAWSALRKALR